MRLALAQLLNIVLSLPALSLAKDRAGVRTLGHLVLQSRVGSAPLLVYGSYCIGVTAERDEKITLLTP